MQDAMTQSKGLTAWSETKVGRSVTKLLEKELATFLPKLQGTFAVQIGQLNHANLLSLAKMPFKILLDPEPKKIAGLTSVRSHLHTLPFASASVDCLILSFTQQCVVDLLAFYHEVERILSPGGYVCVIGLNPFSFFGLFRYAFLCCPSSRRYFPWNRGLISKGQIKRQFSELGLSLKKEKRLFFRPPFASPCLIKAFQWMDNLPILEKLPLPSGLYLIWMQKNIMRSELVGLEFSIKALQWQPSAWICSRHFFIASIF